MRPASHILCVCITFAASWACAVERAFDAHFIPYPVNGQSRSAVSGDVTGDGQPDIVLVTDVGAITVLDGRHLSTSHSIPIARDPSGLLLNDLDNDGDLDFVVWHGYPGAICVVWNDGAGLADGQSVVPLDPMRIANVAAADVNQDGAGDLIVAPVATGAVESPLVLLSGDGAGGFSPRVELPLRLGDAGWMLLADWNHDGTADLAVGSRSRRVLLLFAGNGDGTFTGLGELELLHHPYAGVCADVDGDGLLDLVSAGEYWSGDGAPFEVVAVFLRRGSGWEPVHPVLKPGDAPAGAASWLDATDIDGDGHLDLLLSWRGSYPSSVMVTSYIGQGDGHFARTFTLSTGSAVTTALLVDFGTGQGPDLVTTDPGRSRIRVFGGHRDGRFGFLGSWRTALRGPIAAGQLDGDGRVDLVIGGTGALPVVEFYASLDGGFAPPHPWSAGAFPADLHVADMNDDGLQDLVVGCTYDGVEVHLGDGNGDFLSGIPSGVFSAPRLATGDFNRDGTLDVATVDHRALTVYRGEGDGTVQFLEAWNRPAADLAIADFDGDHNLDIALASGGGFASSPIFTGKGTGRYALSPHELDVPSITRLLSADFNADGRPDLAMLQGDAGVLQVALGNGDLTFRSTASLVTARYAGAIVAEDLDTDGDLDLATLDSDEAQVSVFWGDHEGRFEPGTPYGVDGRAIGLVVADATHDGRPDLVVLSEGIESPLVTVLPNLGGRTPVTLSSASLSRSERGVVLRWRIGGTAPLAVDIIRTQSGDAPGVRIARVACRPDAWAEATDETAESGCAYEYELVVQSPSGRFVLAALRAEVATRGPTRLFALRDPGHGRPVAIRFALADDSAAVNLELFDVAGRQIRRFSPATTAGEHVLSWDRLDARGRPVSRGVYWLRLRTAGTPHSQRLLLLHD